MALVAHTNPFNQAAAHTWNELLMRCAPGYWEHHLRSSVVYIHSVHCMFSPQLRHAVWHDWNRIVPQSKCGRTGPRSAADGARQLPAVLHAEPVRDSAGYCNGADATRVSLAFLCRNVAIMLGSTRLYTSSIVTYHFRECAHRHKTHSKEKKEYVENIWNWKMYVHSSTVRGWGLYTNIYIYTYELVTRKWTAKNMQFLHTHPQIHGNLQQSWAAAVRRASGHGARDPVRRPSGGAARPDGVVPFKGQHRLLHVRVCSQQPRRWICQCEYKHNTYLVECEKKWLRVEWGWNHARPGWSICVVMQSFLIIIRRWCVTW